MNLHYIAKINGRKSHNSEPAGVTVHGQAEITSDVTVFDAMLELVEHVREQTKEFPLVDAIQITLAPKEMFNEPKTLAGS